MLLIIECVFHRETQKNISRLYQRGSEQLIWIVNELLKIQVLLFASSLFLFKQIPPSIHACVYPERRWISPQRCVSMFATNANAVLNAMVWLPWERFLCLSSRKRKSCKNFCHEVAAHSALLAFTRSICWLPGTVKCRACIHLKMLLSYRYFP